MTTTRKPKLPKVVEVWRTSDSPAELDDIEQVARSIIEERPDLLPSVAKIMGAELEPSGRRIAINLFNDSLTQPGDPNRNPSVAIAEGLAGQPAGGPA